MCGVWCVVCVPEALIEVCVPVSLRSRYILRVISIARYNDALHDANCVVWDYMGSSPDPGCEFPASTSPKIRGHLER